MILGTVGFAGFGWLGGFAGIYLGHLLDQRLVSGYVPPKDMATITSHNGIVTDAYAQIIDTPMEAKGKDGNHV